MSAACRLRARALLACLALAACGSGSSLEGSVGEVIPLAFDGVQVQRSASAIALLYTQALPGGGAANVLLKVTASTSGLDLTKPLQIDLTEKLGTAQRGAVSRAVADDPRRDFGPLERGFVRLDAAPALGAHVSGTFSVLFAQGAGLGAGKTAFGDFSATVTEAGK